MKKDDAEWLCIVAYFSCVAGCLFFIVGLILFNNARIDKTANDASIAASTLRIAEAVENIERFGVLQRKEGTYRSAVPINNLAFQNRNGRIMLRGFFVKNATDEQLDRIQAIPGCAVYATVRDGVVYPERCR